MKRLMILGARRERQLYVEAARREHYEVIVGCEDKSPGDLGALIPHVSLSLRDHKEALAAAINCGISGILGVGRDAALSASYIAQRLGLPGIPYAEVRMFHSKILFREFQRRYRFRSPGFCNITLSAAVEDLEFPLYVGASDSNVIRENVLAGNREELLIARRRAIDQSTGGVIAQEDLFHHPDIPFDSAMMVMTNLIIRKGALQIPLWTECVTGAEPGNLEPMGGIYPAAIGENSRFRLAAECKRLVRLLGLADAEIGVIAYVPKGSVPYILSLGPIGRSGQMSQFLSKLYRRNLIREAVRLAAGDRISGRPLRAPKAPVFRAFYILHTDQSGILRRIQIHESLHVYMMDLRLYVRQSQQIYAEKRRIVELGTLFLQFEDRKTMDYIMGHIEELIEVTIDAFAERW